MTKITSSIITRPQGKEFMSKQVFELICKVL